MPPPDPTSRPAPRSLEIFREAPPEVQTLIKDIMAKERMEQHKKNRQDIFQDLQRLIRESTP
jgi:hypothetical protein